MFVYVAYGPDVQLSNMFSTHQDDDAVCIEAAAPVGGSGAWGMAAQRDGAPIVTVNPSPMNDGAAKNSDAGE